MTIVTDNFNRANGGLGSNWATLTSLAAPRVVSNEAAGAATSGDSVARYTATAIGADQYSQAVFAAVADAGPTCRCSPSAGNGYALSVMTNAKCIAKFTNGRMGSSRQHCCLEPR